MPSIGIHVLQQVSWLPDARSPMWFQLSITRMPGVSASGFGTRNTPIRGSGSCVRAQTASQRSAGMPVL
jgi:hypothetical protein